MGGYANLTKFVISFHSVNLESLQSEASLLIKRLKDSEKKVASSSVAAIKEQYLTAIQVGCYTSPHHQRAGDCGFTQAAL